MPFIPVNCESDQEMKLPLTWDYLPVNFIEPHDFYYAEQLTYTHNGRIATINIEEVLTWGDLYRACNECVVSLNERVEECLLDTFFRVNQTTIAIVVKS